MSERHDFGPNVKVIAMAPERLEQVRRDERAFAKLVFSTFGAAMRRRRLAQEAARDQLRVSDDA